MQRSFTFVLLLVVCLVCLGPLAAQDAVVWPTQEWPTSTPEEQGMDSARLLEALAYVDHAGLEIDSITVIRNGHIVLDTYYYPYTADRPHHLHSATKSFIATLVGIAVDQGLIQGLDQPIFGLFPEIRFSDLVAHQQAFTVGNALTMSSGLSCPSMGLETEAAMLDASYVLQPILDLFMGSPGRANSYCNLNSDLLAAAVASVADQPLLDYANQYLFEPIGITDYTWLLVQGDLPFGGWGLHLTPHDMARLGYLYLHNGEWSGEQVVSPEWVSLATCSDPGQCPFADVGYGYHWWVYGPDLYSALGLAGQYIAVAPDEDMVVIVTGSGNTIGSLGSTLPYQLIGSRIVGAATSKDPLPGNPESLSALEERVAALALPQPQAFTSQPAICAQISGVDFQLDQPLVLSFLPPQLAQHNWGAPMEFDSFRLTCDDTREATLNISFIDGHEMSLQVGMDGVPGINDTRVGTLAVTGDWTPDAPRFGVEIEFVGEGDLQRLNINFGENPPRVVWRDAPWGSSQYANAVARPEPVMGNDA